MKQKCCDCQASKYDHRKLSESCDSLIRVWRGIKAHKLWQAGSVKIDALKS
jgi:hypothetical protein